MYNHPVNKIYFLLNTEKTSFSSPLFPKKTHLFFLGVPEVFYYYYMLNETKKAKWT